MQLSCVKLLWFDGYETVFPVHYELFILLLLPAENDTFCMQAHFPKRKGLFCSICFNVKIWAHKYVERDTNENEFVFRIRYARFVSPVPFSHVVRSQQFITSYSRSPHWATLSGSHIGSHWSNKVPVLWLMACNLRPRRPPTPIRNSWSWLTTTQIVNHAHLIPTK